MIRALFGQVEFAEALFCKGVGDRHSVFSRQVLCLETVDVLGALFDENVHGCGDTDDAHQNGTPRWQPRWGSPK